jgi:hypothetical protein
MAHPAGPSRAPRCLLATLLALAAILTLACSSLAVAGWTKPLPVYLGRSGPTHSTVVDGSGAIHIAVGDGGTSPGLRYIRGIGSTSWSTMRLTNRLDVEPSIALHKVGGHDRLAIVFVRVSGPTLARQGLWLASNDSGTWLTTKIFSGAARQPSAAFVGGHLAVAFQDGSHRLRYLVRNGSSSTTEVVSGACCTGGASLGVASGTPWIAFSERNPGSTPERLQVATGGSGWTLQTVDSRDTSSPSIAFTSGTPHLAYVAKGVGVVWSSPAQSGWGKSLIFGDCTAADIATDATGVLVIVGSDLTHVRIQREDVQSGPLTVATGVGGGVSSPEVVASGGKTRVVYDFAGGGTADGVYVTAEK